MKSKKILFITIFIVAFIIGGIVIIGVKTKNEILNYDTVITIDNAGNTTINESVVIEFNSYYNYIYRDIFFNKNLSNNPLTKNLSYTDYGQLDHNIEVKVYEGNVYDGDSKEITNLVQVGYSFNNDKDRYGELISCVCNEDETCAENCESIYIDADKYGKFEGTFTFSYTYTLYGMVTKYNDCAELNYRVFDSLGFDAKSAYVVVYLPNSSLDDNFLSYYHGGTDGNSFVRDNHTMSYEAQGIKEDDAFEIRCVFPKELVSELDSKYSINSNMLEKITEYEDNLTKEEEKKDLVEIILTIVFTIIIFVYIVIIIIVYFKYDKEFKPKFNKQYLNEPPFDYSPAIMSYLYHFGSVFDDDVIATLFDLIRRKVIKLDYNDNIDDLFDKYYEDKVIDKDEKKEIKELNCTLTLLNDDYMNDVSIYSFEKEVIDLFIKRIGDGTKVTFEDIDNFGKTLKNAKEYESSIKRFKSKVKKESKKYKFFISQEKVLHKISSLGFISLIFSFIILILCTSFELNASIYPVILLIVSIIFIIYTSTIKKRTLDGNEQFAMWKAYKNYLEEKVKINDKGLTESDYNISFWEQQIVYAISFGISEKLMKDLEVIGKSSKITLSGENTYLYYNHNYGFNFFMYNRMRYSYNHMMMNSYSQISSHQGGSNHSGFSGGSSFGGGGGGFHGGR